MIFEDRYHAGELLAKKLSKLKFDRTRTRVVAIPRGGVAVASVVCQRLSIPLSIIVIKKLSAPFNPELAIGATASFGKPVLDRWLIADLSVSADYLKKEIIKKKKEAKARERYLGLSVADKDYFGRVVIVIDDGLATGQTAKAAAKMIRAFEPSKLILAIPCASPETIELVKNEYDKVVCLEISGNLMAVGQFYRDFKPITDEEVKSILATIALSGNN